MSKRTRGVEWVAAGLVAACGALGGAENWQPLFENEAWYRQQAGQEAVFKGKLEAVEGAGGPSALMRTAYYRLGDRTLYTGARRIPALDALVGKEVELRGKAVDMELTGQALGEIWPAAVRPSAPAAPQTAPAFAQITIRDVQPLFGGRDLWLSGNGRLIVSTFDPRKGGKALTHHGIQLSEAQVAATAKLVAERGFFEIKIPERFGVPDEARPAITVRLADGTEKTVTKWANDKHADFDALYKHLLALCGLATKKGKLLYEGPLRGAPKQPDAATPLPNAD